MEKISGILPASPRTRTTDVSRSQPARPGAPSLGRPMGKNSLAEDKVTFSARSRELAQMPPAGDTLLAPATNLGPVKDEPVTMTSGQSKETAKARVVKEMAEKFFSPKPDVGATGQTKTEEVLNSMESNRKLAPLKSEQLPAPAPKLDPVEV